MESKRPRPRTAFRAVLLALPLSIGSLATSARPAGPSPERAPVRSASSVGEGTGDRAARSSCDLVLVGQVFTGDPNVPWSSVVAVREGRIAYLGNTSNLSRLVGRHTRVIRARAGTILAGFRDAHLHLGTGLLGSGVVDLRGAESEAAIADRVRTHLAQHPGLDPVLGFGWRLDDLGVGRSERLDGITLERELFLLGRSPFALWANPRAIDAARIEERFPVGADPAGTWIVRDDAGKPSGIFLGTDFADLFPHLPVPDAQAQRAALTRELGELSRHGITAVRGPLSASCAELLEALRERGDLHVRVEAEALRENSPLQALGDDPRLVAILEAHFDRTGRRVTTTVEASHRVAAAPQRSLLLSATETVPRDTRRLARPALLLDACWRNTTFLGTACGLSADLLRLPLRRFEEAGNRLEFGSDYPLAPLDPLLAVDVAMHHADEPLTLEEALRAATGAVLTVGAPADLVVLDRNISAFADADLSRVGVQMTIVGGKVVFER
ncbi:MAG TPA: hypothetical protein ENJ09_03065 [Planctomycetes bacterium]|nr:hypothetical protein [Planctomycetota bacterium]